MPAYISYLAPALLGCMDPGSWAASIEGGSRFGLDLVWVLFLSRLIAFLLRSLSARLRLATGKHLAQACYDQYPTGVCLLLCFLSELSLLVLDAAMVLSFAVGLNLVLGLPVLVGVVVLVAVNVLLHTSCLPFLAPAKSEAMVGAVLLPVLLVFLLSALLSRPPLRPLLGGLWPAVKSESLYAVIGLFGANIVPHKLFRNVERQDASVFYVVLSGALRIAVNLAVMVVAAATFHNAGFAVLTLQDGYVAVEQVFSHWAAPPAFGMALVCAGLSSTWTGIVAGEIASEGFLGRRVNPRLHRLTMQAAAAAVAFVCAWTHGNEGIYQVLVFSQALLVLQLPFTFIPLIRLTSSTAYMGKDKISSLLEGLAWLVLLLILSLDVCLVFGTLFNQSEEWESWEVSGGTEWSSLTVLVMLTMVTVAVGFLVWIVFAPIRSDTHASSSVCTEEALDLGTQVGEKDTEDTCSSSETTTPSLFSSSSSKDVKAAEEVEAPPAVNEALEMRVADYEVRRCLAELPADVLLPLPVDELKIPNGEAEFSKFEEQTLESVPDRVAEDASLAVEVPGLPAEADNSLAGIKDEDEVDVLEKLDHESAADDIISPPGGDVCPFGSEGGSLSRQSGLGRAARRQFSTILEEFWGLLFDYHGQPVGLEPVKASGRGVQESGGTFYAGRGGDNLLKPSNSLDGLTRSHSNLAASTSHPPSRWLFDYGGRSPYPVGGDQRYSSLRQFSYHEDVDCQPATIHGYNIASYTRAGSLQNVRSRPLHLDLQPRRSSGDFSPGAFFYKTDSGYSSSLGSGENVFSAGKTGAESRDAYAAAATDGGQWGSFASESVDRWNPLVYRATGELEKSLVSNAADRAPLPFDDISPSQTHRDGFSIQAASQRTDSLWSRQPFEQLFGYPGGERQERKIMCSFSNGVEFDASVLEHLRSYMRKLLQLDGSDWLFRTQNGCDEDLIACVAFREKFLLNLEAKHQPQQQQQQQSLGGVNTCGDSCVWGSSLLVSFGVWCIHRVLELALMESRPELWGKYTYVLNRLQGILEPAFSSRSVPQPCSCLEGYEANGKVGHEEVMIPACCWSWGRNSSNAEGKPASSLVYLEMIKEVENAVGSRKGRTGTAAGDIAFPKGKGNLASVLKRYKRRLGNKAGNNCIRRTNC